MCVGPCILVAGRFSGGAGYPATPEGLDALLRSLAELYFTFAIFQHCVVDSFRILAP